MLTEFDYFIHQLPRLFDGFPINDEFIRRNDVGDAELNSREDMGKTTPNGSPIDGG